jgi:hypothetical protein
MLLLILFHNLSRQYYWTYNPAYEALLITSIAKTWMFSLTTLWPGLKNQVLYTNYFISLDTAASLKVNIIIIIFIIIWLYSPIWALASPFWGFLTITFLQGWIVSPASNSQPGGPGLCIYDPRGQGDPAIPPCTGYPFQSPFTTCMGYSGTIF